MKKTTLTALAIFCFFFMVLVNPDFVYTETTTPSTGNTGAPGEQSCNQAGCHVGNNVNLDMSKLTLSSVSPDITSGYAPNTLYNLYINLSSGTSAYGFEITALDANNNAAGTFSKTDLTKTELTTANNRQYISHKAANSKNAWAFRWQAPATDIGEVTFYFVGLGADGDGTAAGDVVYRGRAVATTSSFSQLNLTGIAPINADKVASLSIFPNPIKDKLTVQYYLHEACKMKVELLDLNGKTVQQLDEFVQAPGFFQRSFTFNEQLTSGIYLLKITEGEQVYVKKLLAE